MPALGLGSLWVALLVGVFLALRDREPDPNQHSWVHGLSDSLAPSLPSRAAVVGLSFILALVVLAGSCATSLAVAGAGQRCDGPRSRR